MLPSIILVHDRPAIPIQPYTSIATNSCIRHTKKHHLKMTQVVLTILQGPTQEGLM